MVIGVPRPSHAKTFVTRRPFCLRRFCTASLVLSTSLVVHKQSFLNLLRRNGRHKLPQRMPTEGGGGGGGEGTIKASLGEDMPTRPLDP